MGRWVFSYSDMITLLFAFFVFLASVSNINQVKLEMASDFFSDKKSSNRVTYKELTQMIQNAVVSEKLQDEVKVVLTPQGVEINLKDKLMFDVGRAEVKMNALPILLRLSNLLNQPGMADRVVLVEGHTDSVPIKSVQYPSNWELSSSRAASVVKFFIGKKSDAKRFKSIGYADTHPIAKENDSITGEPANRRVVIVITSESFVSGELRKEIKVEELFTGTDEGALKISVPIKTEPVKTETAPVAPVPAVQTPQTPQKVQPQVVPKSEPVKKTVIQPQQPGVLTDVQKDLIKDYYIQAQEAYQSKKYELAIYYWQKVLELNPNHQLASMNVDRAKDKLKNKK